VGSVKWATWQWLHVEKGKAVGLVSFPGKVKSTARK
jgi:hypothetical protein